MYVEQIVITTTTTTTNDSYKRQANQKKKYERRVNAEEMTPYEILIWKLNINEKRHCMGNLLNFMSIFTIHYYSLNALHLELGLWRFCSFVNGCRHR